ncbi:MAG: flagellar biosynthesis protein FlhA [Phycisphaeraceae bacterium]|nr:flagellar biosynthesis protein FlhA [Phycisphaeraceae bacterium]
MLRRAMELIARHRGLIVPLGFVSLMVVILVPMPAWLIDVLICFNIAASVIVLLTTIYMAEPLDFSVFPSLLLGMTLFRLVLNVATTRRILMADAATPEAAIGVAGNVISAFANFVAGDSLFVGVVIFLILVIVQFVVITKGATRISEVAARFTLDAMPGKQMAIDADLSAGIINESEARKRRERIAHEADFFGAMDGASKFVRGDAIAGIIITCVNIAGGFAIGMIERGWPAGQTATVFTLLTIGDGLTSQIPSFVVAIAAALIVTRSGSKQQLGEELAGQMVSQPISLALTAGFLVVLAATPLPTVPLLGTATVLGITAWWMNRAARHKAANAAEEQAANAKPAPAGPTPESLMKVDALELEVGYGLVGLVDAGQGGDLLERIAAIRRQLVVELGFILPPVRIRDNMQLGVHEYRVKIKGAVVATGQTIPGRLMAMDSGVASGPIQGERTREPAFGLDAWWIDPALKARAETMNYTVVDPTSVLATHLTEVVRGHSSELLTREEVNNLVAALKEKAPKLVEEVVPAMIKPGELQRVMQNLLRERVPVRDLETILETLSEWGARTKDLDVLTEYVRNALRRTICQQYTVPVADSEAGATGGVPGGNGGGRLVCVTLDPALEDVINAYIDRATGATTVNMPARVATQVTEAILGALQQVVAQGHQPVVLASPQVRAVVRQLLEPRLPNAAVLGYNEVVPGVEVESVGLVSPPASVGLSIAPAAAA